MGGAPFMFSDAREKYSLQQVLPQDNQSKAPPTRMPSNRGLESATGCPGELSGIFVAAKMQVIE
jgi:hypothetical protein